MGNLGVWEMATCRCVAVVLAAAVFITGSCVEEAEGGLEKQIFDSIAPLLNESEGQGELVEGADPSENTALLTALSDINKKLSNAKPQEASGVLNKHFTKELWSKWGDHVKAKELDNDTAEGILNSYLCAKLKEPKMLVAVINWVRGTSKKMRQAEEAEGSEDAKESAKAEDAKKAIQKAKKEDDEKEEAEKVETAEKEKADDEKAEKKEAKEEKMDAEKDAKDAKKEAKEDAKDAKKEAEEAKKEAKEEAEEAKKEAKKEVEEVKAK